MKTLLQSIQDFARNGSQAAHNARVIGLIFITAVGVKVFLNNNIGWDLALGGFIFAAFCYFLITVFADIFVDKNQSKRRGG